MKLYQNREWMRRRYQAERKTAAEIAKECGTTEMTIDRWLAKHGLKSTRR